MSNYVDLVLVKHNTYDDKNYLFYAPFSSGIKEGETVIVDTKRGAQTGLVVGVLHVAKDNEEYEFAKLAAGATELKRVLARAVPYDYSDEDYIEGVK